VITAARVTVLIPVYDGQRYIGEALDSVIAQDFSDLEVLVVDDGSTDGSAEIVQRYARIDRRVRLERLPRHGGVAVALQHGLSQAQGEQIVRLDADDIAAPGRVRKQVGCLEARPEVVLVGGAYDLIDAAGHRFDLVRGPTDERELRWWLLFGNVFCHSTVAFRRDAARAVGGYRAGLTIEDYDLWIRLAAYGGIAMIDEVMAQRRVHDRNLTARPSAELRDQYVRTVAASLQRSTGTAVSLDAARWLAAETSALPATDRAIPEAIATIATCLDRGVPREWCRIALPLAVLELTRVARRARPGVRGAAWLLLAFRWALARSPRTLLLRRYWGALVGLAAAIAGPRSWAARADPT
jgi:hypothetical protein